MTSILKILGRQRRLFEEDLLQYEDEINEIVSRSKFLIIGGGGSIGQAVSKELFSRGAKCLHVVDLNENYLVELVRDLRSSSQKFASKNFDTFSLDCGDPDFEKFIKYEGYDYILNLSAMKHVRSENNAFSMARMIKINIQNVLSTYQAGVESGVKKYFCVSTDKAANPANFMGATKRAMEMCLMTDATPVPVSGARFANVAFSNGSLLEGFEHRLKKRQPLSVPADISRYFITAEESGLICLFSAILGERNEIYFPRSTDVNLTRFLEITHNFLSSHGLKVLECTSEDEARMLINEADLAKYWPVNIFQTDTVGEKPFEEFHTEQEEINTVKYRELGVIKYISYYQREEINKFFSAIDSINLAEADAQKKLLGALAEFVPTFSHISGSKFLNERM